MDGQHEVTLSIPAPAAGALRVGIEERGVTLVAMLDNAAATEATSPVERFGTIFLVTDTTGSRSHSVRIRANDSPDMKGEVCLAAYLVPNPLGALSQANAAFARGGRATRMQDWDEAFEAYREAARRFDGLDRPGGAGAARHAMAELAYRRFDRKRDAYALAAQALSDYGNGADPIFKGLLTGLRANSLIETPGNDTHAVAAQMQELLAKARQYDSASRFGGRELPRLDIMTGYLEYFLDALAPASASFKQAAQQCRESGDWGCYAIASQNLAMVQEGTSYESAMAAYTNALRHLPDGLEPRLRADISVNLGRLQGRVGLFSASERSHEAAMREYAQLGDCPGVRRTMSRLGTLMTWLGVIGDAETYLQRSASLDCADLLHVAGARPADIGAPATTDIPTPQRNSGAALTSRAGLCTHPLEAANLAGENQTTVFNSLLSLGNVLMMEGELPQAQRCFEAAPPYAVNSRTQIRLENARGSLLLERTDSAAARAAFTEALRLADTARLPATYENRGVARLGMLKAALLSGETTETLQQSYAALRSSVVLGDIDQTITSLRLIAAGYRDTHQGEAVRTLLTAADLIEAVPIDQLDGEKRATYLATQYDVFADLADLLASQAETNQEQAWLAFATSERGRARSLRYAVTQAARSAADSLDAPPTTRYREMLREVAHLTEANGGGADGDSRSPQDISRDDRGESLIGDREGDLPGSDLVQQLDNVARRERGVTEPFDRNQLMRTLAQLDANLVEYAAGPHDMFAFIVNASGVQVVRVADKRRIAAAAADLLFRLRDPESPGGEVRAAAAQLARLVLWPLDDRLSGKRIVFVPDDALHTVPFSVLPWSAAAPNQLVLQHAEVSIVPSASFLMHDPGRRARRRVEAPRMELIGDPVFGTANWRRECLDREVVKTDSTTGERSSLDWVESLPRLPGSRTEVLGIEKVAREARPAAQIRIALGCDAVPGVLRRAAAERTDLLHIATHARVDAQRPRLSALALTSEGGNEGASAFGLLDILGLKLNSSLVVLSACDTSRGRLLPGEGVLGPAQAFLEAGAAAVIASYWRVDDQATAAFMQQFYRHLLLEGLPASRALRQAQLDQAASSPSYDWAAFALYGWPDSGM
ncbi:MAG TPA: CHAT domain-containing protein [Steroidobacteraceae bacterium]|nr:CHAT domain-containing protein [Steroidobacteraceae bacterium]